MIAIRKAIIFVHRWLGVALSLLFLLWFSSGIVMMYWGFPSVTAQDRLDRSPELNANSIRFGPSEAYAKLETSQPPGQVRINTFDGRPVYRFRTGREERLVFADNGDALTQVSAQMIERAARGWTGQSAGLARVQSVKEVDQWTVQGPLRNLRPLWKFSWPNGEEVYISGVSGEVVQYTTGTSRLWAWLGAIPHWLYFTPLRKYQIPWTRAVEWISGLGTLSAILGMVVGIWMYSPGKRYRHAGVPTSIPYQGWKRWHTVIGLMFGITAATWAFSGFLSMDPLPGQARRADAGVNIPAALRGRFRLTEFDNKLPSTALAQIRGGGVKELELTSLSGEPVYLATVGRRETRIIPIRGEPAEGFDTARIIELIRQGAGTAGLAEVRVIDDYDSYYLDRRRERPLPVIFVRLSDARGTRYYIDPKTARVVGNYNSSRWISRWLYHGLHSWDFPWLYKYRPLWDIVVIIFMLGGSLLCATSLILAWRVVRRTVAGLVSRSPQAERASAS
jgi:hypothetical protein